MNAYLAKSVIDALANFAARIRELELQVEQLQAERDHFEKVAQEAQVDAAAAKKALADQLRAHDRERRKWANMGR